MSSAEKTYSDTTDQALRSMATQRLFDQWNQFEHAVFNTLLADKTISRGVLLNAGAGRRVTEAETPFFGSFSKVYLLEPDNERRTALAQSTKDSGAILLADRIENLDASAIEAADFVQCKYVLQHIRTDLLPLAVERLKSVVADNGIIGIFSTASAGESYFNLDVPQDFRHLAPADLLRDPSGRITEAQFNLLMSRPPEFPFIATHHISLQSLMGYFEGWNPALEAGPSHVCFLRARKPATSKVKGLIATIKAIFDTKSPAMIRRFIKR